MSRCRVMLQMVYRSELLCSRGGDEGDGVGDAPDGI